MASKGGEITTKDADVTVCEEAEELAGTGEEAEPMTVDSSDKGSMTPGNSMAALPSSSSDEGISGIDRLLQQHRSEIMFELRRLQLGDRPVTGQGNKEAVENFFARTQNGEADAAGNSEHRPENVTVEVSALIERRPVSSLLRSVQFRRSLETALQGALGSVRLPQSLTSGAGTNLTQRNSPRAVEVPPAPSLPRADLFTSEPSPSSAQSPRRTNGQEHHVTAEREVTGESSSPASDGPQLQQPADGRGQTNRDGDHPAERDALHELLNERVRDEVIADISELVQQQLVTSSLEGNFRNRLERLMESHLDGVEADRQRVQEFIHSLPARRPVRNDFSHLGINTGTFPDDLDTISVISATATVAGRHAQSNVGLSREINALKAQLSEMRHMMQMSFDLQLDIQRAIRQEVAAAIHNVLADSRRETGGPSPSERSSAAMRSVPFTDGKCVVCVDMQADAVLYQCGHLCVCYSCGMNLQARGDHCPLCRAPIRDIIRTYRCTLE